MRSHLCTQDSRAPGKTGCCTIHPDIPDLAGSWRTRSWRHLIPNLRDRTAVHTGMHRHESVRRDQQCRIPWDRICKTRIPWLSAPDCMCLAGTIYMRGCPEHPCTCPRSTRNRSRTPPSRTRAPPHMERTAAGLQVRHCLCSVWNAPADTSEEFGRHS